MSKPIWITPKGFLITATENVFTTFNISATGTDISYDLLNGNLPNGLSFTSTGTFLGTPTSVLDLTSSTFTIRAFNNEGSNDRTFRIDIDGPDNPTWITSPGIINAGPNGENYIQNGQYINYQFTATSDTGTVNYFLISGNLPKNLELTENGTIKGYVNDNVVEELENFDFAISASNGISFTTSSFRLILFRTLPNEIIPLQWIGNSDLGTLQSNQNYIFKLPLLDPRPNVGTLFFNVTTGTLPNNLELNSASGILSGFVTTQNNFKENFTFDISATKTINENFTVTTQTFQLSVINYTDEKLSWNTTGSLGTVVIGKPITLEVNTIAKNSIQSSKYKIKSGSLPPGITLNLDGLITGVVPINTATSTETLIYDFEINGLDSNNNILSTGTFSITTIQTTSTEYTKIYCRPYLSLAKRNLYQEYINNTDIFNQNWIYRSSDPNFGIKKDMRIILDFGIKVQYLYDYYSIIKDRFYKRKFQISDIKILPYRTSQGNIIYEMVYLEVLDQFENNLSKNINARTADLTLSTLYDPIIPDEFEPTSTATYYNTIQEIRNSVREEIDFTDNLNPDFLTTWSVENNTLTNYFVYIPICYATPGKGNLIKNRTENFGFDFKIFDIEIDRIILEKTKR